MKERVMELINELALTEEQIDKLEKIGFFTVPASSKHHLAIKGGLMQHSLNVCETALKINDSMTLGLNRQWIILATLFHDIDKVSYYEENILKSGKQSEAQPYKWNPKVILPHGSGSVYWLCNELNINLPVPVATAISYHMGEFQEGFADMTTILSKQPLDMVLTWLVQTADRYATWIIETEVSDD